MIQYKESEGPGESDENSGSQPSASLAALAERQAVMQIVKDETSLDPRFPFRIFRYQARPEAEAQAELTFHWHECMEITWVLEGSGSYYVNGREYTVGRGDMIIFNNVEIHGWRVLEEMSLLVLTFAPDLISDGTRFADYDYLLPFVQRGSHFENLIRHQEDYTSEMTRIALQIEEEDREQRLGSQLMIKAYILQLLTILIRHYQKTSPPRQSLSTKKAHMKRLEQVVAYIRSHYQEPLTLEELAQMAYMSPTYFSSYFKKVTGRSLKEYLIDLRISRAEELLTAGDMSILEVADSCGFPNVSNFYRLYKKRTGQSPGKTRG